MKKKLIIILLLLISINFIFPQTKISYIYKNKFVSLALAGTKDIPLEKSYNALKDLDSSLYFRVTLSTVERSRLKNLFYVGNKIEFNNVELKSIDFEQYSIKDLINNFKIDFQIGTFESIEILSVLDFGEKKIDTINKIATVMCVKELFKKLNGDYNKEQRIPEIIEKMKFENEIIAKLKSSIDLVLINRSYLLDEKRNLYYLSEFGKNTDNKEPIFNILIKVGFNEKSIFNIQERTDSYVLFVNQLKMINRKEVFNYLKRFVELNFQLVLNSKVDEGFISPYDLFYSREGNYKSIAFFYYYTIKMLNQNIRKDSKEYFNIKSYLVSDLKRRTSDDFYEIKKLKSSNKQAMEIQYKNVDSKYNLEEMILYYPPAFEKSIYLVAFQIDNEWIYTTGEKWIKDGILKPERSCSSYTKKGCYYSEIIKDELYNSPLREDDVLWDVFYDLK